MTLATIIGFAAILSYLSFKNAFFGLKLLAGMSWFVLFIYLKDNPPDSIVEGSGIHTAFLVVSIGFGLMVVLAGLGRGVSRRQKSLDGKFEVSQEGGFSFRGVMDKFNSWNSGESERSNTDRGTSNERAENYRATLRQAYRRKTK